jgi:hypothetical protein
MLRPVNDAPGSARSVSYRAWQAILVRPESADSYLRKEIENKFSKMEKFPAAEDKIPGTALADSIENQ